MLETNKCVLRALRKAGTEWRFLVQDASRIESEFSWQLHAALVVEMKMASTRFIELYDVARYDGNCWWRMACISVAILNSTRAFIGNQCRWCSAGLICARQSSLRTSRAAVQPRSAHAASCRRTRVDAESPLKTVTIVYSAQYQRRHQLFHNFISHYTSQWSQPAQAEVANTANFANVWYHSKFWVKHYTKIAHSIGTMDGRGCDGEGTVFVKNLQGLVGSGLGSQINSVFTARCTLVQSAVLRSYIVRPSVRLSVCNV